MLTSEEKRRINSESHKGLIKSEEHRRNLSKAMSGRKLSEQHKEALQIARENSEKYKNRGPKISEAIRKDIGSRTGENNWTYGKPFTAEHRANLSKARKGRVYTEETRRKLSVKHRGEDRKSVV